MTLALLPMLCLHADFNTPTSLHTITYSSLLGVRPSTTNLKLAA